MATLFTKIIEGELPGRFVWRDDVCVAFLTIAPLKPGHLLVVPRLEVEHFIDLPDDVWAHVAQVSKTIAKALDAAYQPEKVGMLLAGLEVPHVHVHLCPIWELTDIDFGKVDTDPDPADLDAAAETVRAALRAAGHPEVSD